MSRATLAPNVFSLQDADSHVTAYFQQSSFQAALTRQWQRFGLHAATR